MEEKWGGAVRINQELNAQKTSKWKCTVASIKIITLN